MPFPGGLHLSDYEVEAWRMFAQIDHHKPIVNGYSGNFPQARTPLGLIVPIYTQFQLAMAQQFPSEQLFCIMDRSDPVSFVDSLRAAGYVVEPVAEVQRPFLRAMGTLLRISGGDLTAPAEVESYNYDDRDLGTDGIVAARADAVQIQPDDPHCRYSLSGLRPSSQACLASELAPFERSR